MVYSKIRHFIPANGKFIPFSIADSLEVPLIFIAGGWNKILKNNARYSIAGLDNFINIGYLKKVKPIITLPDYNLFKSSLERILTVGKRGITI